jgi:hypothetical protein
MRAALLLTLAADGYAENCLVKSRCARRWVHWRVSLQSWFGGSFVVALLAARRDAITIGEIDFLCAVYDIAAYVVAAALSAV